MTRISKRVRAWPFPRPRSTAWMTVAVCIRRWRIWPPCSGRGRPRSCRASATRTRTARISVPPRFGKPRAMPTKTKLTAGSGVIAMRPAPAKMPNRASPLETSCRRPCGRNPASRSPSGRRRTTNFKAAWIPQRWNRTTMRGRRPADRSTCFLARPIRTSTWRIFCNAPRWMRWPRRPKCRIFCAELTAARIIPRPTSGGVCAWWHN